MRLQGNIARTLYGTCLLSILLAGGSASAQSALGPHPQRPPSYGEPPSPLLTGYNTRVFAAIAGNLGVAVDINDLQKLLPPGYTAIPNATDPTRATVSCVIESGVYTQTAGPSSIPPGTYGPYNAMVISTFAQNPLGNQEFLQLAGYANNQEIVDINNAMNAAGTSHYADISVVTKNSDGATQLHVVGRDPATGLVINAVLSAPDQITTQSRNLGPVPVRQLALGAPTIVANTSLSSVSSDGMTVPVLPGSVDVNNVRLRFGAGRLRVDEMPVVTAAISWNIEVFFKKVIPAPPPPMP